MEKVLKDFRNGFFSIEKAKEDYGVVIDLLTFKMDEKNAEKKRKTQLKLISHASEKEMCTVRWIAVCP